LLSSGYDIDLTKADPSTLGRTAARARGKGGIILLIIQFFPYFLVGGYGYFVYDMIDSYKADNARIKSLQTVYSYLSERSPEEIYALRRGISVMSESMAKRKLSGNPEHYASALVGKVVGDDKSKEGKSMAQARPNATPQATQVPPRFTRDVNLQTQTVEQTSGGDAEKPISKEESGKAQSEEVDTLGKELEKAERLKERGLISEEEYQALRKKALGL
jgi:hypothetical protein